MRSLHHSHYFSTLADVIQISTEMRDQDTYIKQSFCTKSVSKAQRSVKAGDSFFIIHLEIFSQQETASQYSLKIMLSLCASCSSSSSSWSISPSQPTKKDTIFVWILIFIPLNISQKHLGIPVQFSSDLKLPGPQFRGFVKRDFCTYHKWWILIFNYNPIPEYQYDECRLYLLLWFGPDTSRVGQPCSDNLIARKLLTSRIQCFWLGYNQDLLFLPPQTWFQPCHKLTDVFCKKTRRRNNISWKTCLCARFKFNKVLRIIASTTPSLDLWWDFMWSDRPHFHFTLH